MRSIAITALLVLTLGALVGQCILLVRLREHRTDLRPHEHFGQGNSPIWQVNVLRPANYTPAGRRLLRWMPVLQLVWLACLIMVACLFMGFP